MIRLRGIPSRSGSPDRQSGPLAGRTVCRPRFSSSYARTLRRPIQQPGPRLYAQVGRIYDLFGHPRFPSCRVKNNLTQSRQARKKTEREGGDGVPLLYNRVVEIPNHGTENSRRNAMQKFIHNIVTRFAGPVVDRPVFRGSCGG